jgi:hypothetical protein
LNNHKGQGVLLRELFLRHTARHKRHCHESRPRIVPSLSIVHDFGKVGAGAQLQLATSLPEILFEFPPDDSNAT